jgi:hypothetical protein
VDHFVFIEWEKIPLFVELHLELFINQQYIMHLLVEVWIPTFAIILDAEWLDPAFVQNPIHARFSDSCKPVKTCRSSSLIDMLCKRLCSPGLGSITIVLRLCAGYTDQPGFRLTGDFLFPATAFVYIVKIFNGAFF